MRVDCIKNINDPVFNKKNDIVLIKNSVCLIQVSYNIRAGDLQAGRPVWYQQEQG